MSKNRLRIKPNGSIALPEELRESLEWGTGSYLEYEVKGDRLEIWRVEVDVFSEAMKGPEENKFDDILKKQAEDQSKAFEEFDERIKDPGELRPEDRPEFWD